MLVSKIRPIDDYENRLHPFTPDGGGLASELLKKLQCLPTESECVNDVVARATDVKEFVIANEESCFESDKRNLNAKLDDLTTCLTKLRETEFKGPSVSVAQQLAAARAMLQGIPSLQTIEIRDLSDIIAEVVKCISAVLERDDLLASVR